MAKLKGLGRGLDALFAENEDDAAVRGIRLNDIEPNPDQPRRSFDEEALAELAESIRENGIITPLSVRRRGDRYEIIAGERRWRAARMAGLREVPALVLEADDTAAYTWRWWKTCSARTSTPSRRRRAISGLCGSAG